MAGGDALRFVLPELSHKSRYEAMMAEWTAHGGRLNPGALRSNGASYETWLGWSVRDRDRAACPPGSPPQTLYFVMDGDGRLVGAVTVRHCLTERTLVDGGHVAYGVRPSRRRRGYATAMLALALDKLRELGISRALLTCDADNEASEKVILRNGGVLENIMPDEDGIPVKRFWIDL